VAATAATSVHRHRNGSRNRGSIAIQVNAIANISIVPPIGPKAT
jgi:hypothetical protein